MGVSELSRELGTNKNMVFRLLHTLEEEGWVVQENGAKYRVSLQPFHHFSRPVGRTELRVTAADVLGELWRETGENCYLGILDDDSVLFVEHLDSVRDVRVVAQTGGRYLLHCSAPGKVLLAHAGGALFRRLADKGLRRNTDRTICDSKRLREELGRIVRQGYALDIEEYARGVMCMAAPIVDFADNVVGTVGVSVLALYYGDDEMVSQLGPKLMQAAEKISLRMGMSEDNAERFHVTWGGEE